MSEWDYAEDYASAFLIRETPHGVYRAVIERDEYPEAPEDDAGCPVIRLGGRGYGYTATHEDYGQPDSDVLAALQHFLDRWDKRHAVPAWRRWLRVYRGGQATPERSESYRQDSTTWIAYVTAELRAEWGIPDDVAPTITEWMAYVDGEVYGIRVEKADSFDEDGEPDTWEELDDKTETWGYYGEDYAKQAAAELLDDTITGLAADMLPLAPERG